MIENGIYKYLDCNTGHVTENDMKLLEMVPNQWPVVAMSYPEGAFVYTHLKQEDIKGEEEEFKKMFFSDHFINALRFARKKDCKYICFDRDGEHFEGLEYIEW